MSKTYKKVPIVNDGQWIGKGDQRIPLWGFTVQITADKKINVLGLDELGQVCAEDFGFGNLKEEDAIGLFTAIWEMVNTLNETHIT